ncbi:MAG: 30S ribosomal protein S3 [Nitrospinota bacterium]|jgi:small subunit ribosomal protein S3|nr:30S ribosomal protein S3 [Nitrospinota bacterium]MDP7505187.1 30S ribosomal protein S3 [Nitrospinota bacterium]MDP7663279.1 30S ribosomal protein S3 [Nitrospinota bacterium]
MGQKVHPVGFRVGITRGWQSTWFANRYFADLLHDDLKIRKFVKERLTHAGVSNVEIERASNHARINIWTSRPGIIIGKRGSEVDKLKAELQQLTGNQVYVNIKEVRKAEMDAQLVAENIGMQLERRIAFRRAMKKSVVSAMRFGAKGVKIQCSGRLGGAEIARTEWYREGRVPLGTLRADIDYGVAEAMSTYGVIGVKVWIFRGEMIRTPRRRPASEVPTGKDS